MSSDNPTCPVCESPLTTDAVRARKCQCCGSPLPAPQKQPQGERSA